MLLMESLNLTMCVAGNAARMSACRLYARSVCLYVVFLCNYMFFTPRSTTSYFMRVDWETVGRCVNRALHDLEPEHSRRLDGLVNIGIDETSYKKGHK